MAAVSVKRSINLLAALISKIHCRLLGSQKTDTVVSTIYNNNN